jgi:hypothetical protein
VKKKTPATSREIRTGKRPAGAKRLHSLSPMERGTAPREDPGNRAVNDGPEGSGVQGIDLTNCAALIDGDGDEGEA